jgi:hypothetical protein
MNTNVPVTTHVHPRRFTALALTAAASCCFGTAVAADDYRHVVRSGETLIGIGQELLQRPGDWPRLQHLNKVADPRRLRPGSTLRIPVALLRGEPVEARVTAVKGDVRAGGTQLAVGDSIGRGSQVTTGEQSFATITLVDGSRLALQPGSRLSVDEMSRRRNASVQQTHLRLDSGRVESVVARSAAARPQYTVTTPTATIGVRGTSFRVGVDETQTASRTEVTDGTVAVGGTRDKTRPVAIPAGYGVVASAGGELSKPVTLLPAPEVGALPVLQERTIVRFSVPALVDASRYRFQVGSDRGMSNVLAESMNTKPEAKFADLPDGDYVLRVRGVDARGLEGRDANFPFRLKARPEPPFAVSPVGGSKLRGESAELSWSANTEAARYRVQVAADDRFADTLADIDAVEGTTVMPARKLPPGEYHWRARSIRVNGDAGPWGDNQRFVLKPPPADPAPPGIGDDAINFAWSGEPGQTFLFQFARDAAFADVLAEQRLDAPTTTVARPAAGTHYMRVRATDPDGVVGPFTRPQSIEVPAPPPPWWLLLLLLLPAAL